MERFTDFTRFRCGNRLSPTISKTIETCSRKWKAQPAVSLLVLLRQADEAPAAKSELVLSRLLGAQEHILKGGEGNCQTGSGIGVVVTTFVRVLQETKVRVGEVRADVCAGVVSQGLER